MRSHAKASSAGSTQRQGKSLGRFFRGAFLTRGALLGADGSGAPSHGRATLLALAIAALGLLAFSPAASASVTTRLQTATISGISGPQGLAVDQSTGDVYVIESEAERIARYTPAGAADNFAVPGGSNTITQSGLGGGGEAEIAVDNAPGSPFNGDFYVRSGPGAVAVYASSGEKLGELTGFSEACGVAVDQSSGALYVGDYSYGGVRRFAPVSATAPVSKANYSAETSIKTQGMNPCQVAADKAGHVYASAYNTGPVNVFSAADFAAAPPSKSGTTIDATSNTVMTDPGDNDLYVDEGNQITVFDSSGTLLYRFGSGAIGNGSRGVAVKEGGNAYVANRSAGSVVVFGPVETFSDATATATAPTNVTDTGATLNGTVTDNNAAPTHWRIELSKDGGATWSTVSSGTTAGSETNVAISANATGLVPNSSYRFRITTNKGPGSPDVSSAALSFSTLSAPPLVTEVGAVEVEDTSARLAGTIDPRNSETGYVFEYGTTPALGSSTAPLNVGGGTTPIVVSQPLTGLAKDTTYYFRLVATNAFGTTPSTEATLHTRAQAAPLPDSRAYEQVSPVDKNFGDATQGTAVQLPRTDAVPYDGESVVYGSVNSFGEPPGQILRFMAQYDSRRGPDGWSTQSVFPTTCNNDLVKPQLSFFWIPLSAAVSASGEHAVIPQREASVCETPPLSPAAPLPATNLYRVNFDENSTTYDLVAPNFAEPPVAQAINSVPGLYVGGSDDFSHVYYGTVEQKPPFNAVSGFGGYKKIYEWHNGTLQLASVDPNGNPFTEGSEVGPPGEFRKPLADAVNSVSANGERLFFMNPSTLKPSADVYLREGGTTTYDVSESECTVECGSEFQAEFEWADKEGDEAFFSTSQKLVNSDGPGAEGFSRPGLDLYAYRQSPNPTAEPNLTLVSKDNEPADGTDSKFKEVLGMADDGSTVFFTASSQLVEGQPTAPGQKIYRWSWNEGSPTLQYLAMADHDNQGYPEVTNYERRVSQQGNALMIETSTRVDPVADHDSDIDVYLWREGHGWSCASCQKPGVASSGPSTTSKVGQMKTSLSITESPLITKLSTAISADGERLFFTTPDSLVDADTNGPCSFDSDVGYYPCSDIYEWHDGRVSLITPGNVSADRGLIGISASGRDVFFYTRQSLVGWDRDNSIDVYDARVGGGFPEPPAQPAECEGEACRGQGTGTPAGTGAGTAVFQGPGNPTPKHGKKHRKHRKHRKHHKRANNRNANHSRRAGK